MNNDNNEKNIIINDTTALDTEIKRKESQKTAEKIKKLSKSASGSEVKSEPTFVEEEVVENFETEQVDFKNVTQEEIEKEMKVEGEYTGKDIQALKGLTAIRERPGMYIGSTGPRGLNSLVREIVDNSVDEYYAGHCHNIYVTLLPGTSEDPTNIARIEDDGRGIPVDIVEEEGKSGVEVTFTIMHAGGKFENSSGYKVSGGLHGIGAKAVNALSKKCSVTVYRNGKIYQMRFENGGDIVSDGLEIIGECPIEKTGTVVEFVPDSTIFTETVTFDQEWLKDKLKTTSYLNRGLAILSMI